VINQVKNGNLSVNNFVAMQAAQFDQDIFFRGVLRGDTATNTLKIGGSVSGTTQTVDVAVNGSTEVTGSITSGSLINTNNATLCADTNGKIVLCNGLAMVVNLSYVGTPSGVWGTGECFVTLNNTIPAGMGTQHISVNVNTTWATSAGCEVDIPEGQSQNSAAMDYLPDSWISSICVESATIPVQSNLQC
jgi:hypothetical protein